MKTYPYDLPKDIDVTFENVYPDGSDLYFSTENIAHVLRLAHYDEEHIGFVISALFAYETKFKQDTVKLMGHVAKQIEKLLH